MERYSFDGSFELLVPDAITADVDLWWTLRVDPAICKSILESVLVTQAARALGVNESSMPPPVVPCGDKGYGGSRSRCLQSANQTAEGLMPFCGMMAYQTCQLEYAARLPVAP